MKKTFQFIVTLTCDDQDRNILELKAAVLSGEFQRDLKSGTKITKVKATIKEI